MKTYKLTRFALLFIYGLLGFVSLIGVIAGTIVAIQSLKVDQTLVPIKLILLAWLVALAWIWYIYTRIPVTITWRDDQILEFKSIRTTTVVPVQDLIAIKATPLSWGFIKIIYQGGSLRLLCQITGLYELLSSIKSLNPRVEITGC